MNDCCKKKIRDEEDKKKLLNRISKIIGQMNGIKKMIEDDRYCNDILMQLVACDKAIKSLSSVIFKEHANTCLVQSIKDGSSEGIDEIIELFNRFM